LWPVTIAMSLPPTTVDHQSLFFLSRPFCIGFMVRYLPPLLVVPLEFVVCSHPCMYMLACWACCPAPPGVCCCSCMLASLQAMFCQYETSCRCPMFPAFKRNKRHSIPLPIPLEIVFVWICFEVQSWADELVLLNPVNQNLFKCLQLVKIVENSY
jgi:hypothetical protein